MQFRSSKYPKRRVLRQILKSVFNILRLRSFKVCCIFVSKKCSLAFIIKGFINLAVLKLFIRFLHYVTTMPAFQAGTVASTIVQFRKLIYQTLHEIIDLYELQKQRHGKSNFVVLSPDNEAAKGSSIHQN